MNFKVTLLDRSSKGDIDKEKMIEEVANYIYESNRPIFDSAFSKIIHKWMKETDYNLNADFKVEWIEEIAQEAADEINKNDYIKVPKFNSK